jgi:hypothetical protein
MLTAVSLFRRLLAANRYAFARHLMMAGRRTQTRFEMAP